MSKPQRMTNYFVPKMLYKASVELLLYVWLHCLAVGTYISIKQNSTCILFHMKEIIIFVLTDNLPFFPLSSL
jgi:hypothetical protein